MIESFREMIYISYIILNLNMEGERINRRCLIEKKNKKKQRLRLLIDIIKKINKYS
jgi:hypothetical protein